MTKTSSFQAFTAAWEAKQGLLLEELTAAKDGHVEGGVMKELIARALSQLEEYYEEKSRAANRDVFSMFSPVWCSPLECASHWISGLRPTAIVRLVFSAVDDLSSHQILRLHSLKLEKRREENALSNEQVRIQRAIATPQVRHALQSVSCHPNGFKDGSQQPNTSMKTIEDAMKALVGQADILRGQTTCRIVDILSTKQTILALEATIRLQRNIKIWGMGKPKNVGIGGEA